MLALFALGQLSACAERPPQPDRLTLVPARFADLAGWNEDAQAEALNALVLSCGRIETAADDAGGRTDAPAGGPARGFGDRAAWQAACQAARSVTPGDDGAARAFFERWFTPYLAGNNNRTDGLFTGYYEPELRGSRAPSARFRVPLYRLPDDLVTADLGLFRTELKGMRIAGRVEKGRLKPYHSRAEIEAGALKGRGLEIVFVDDPVDAFFLHIQGSGRVRLEDGTTLRLGYAGANGRPYVAIGREFVTRGAMTKDDVSMQSIRAWLAAHPGEAEKLMAQNPSYVFFRELEGDGPIGAEGVPLTPGRSLAVDPRFVAYGVPVWLEAQDPLDGARRLRRLVVAQDTGGAIAGPVRGDLFWGSGAEAAERAGRMKSQGRYYLLLPRTAEETAAGR